MTGGERALDRAFWTRVLGAAVFVRAAAALVVLRGMPMVSDAREYFDLGARLAAGAPVGAFYWPPGESLALAPWFALFGPDVLVARLVTIAISVGTVVLVTLTARDLAGPRAARAAGWIMALYPPSVLLCGQTYAQHLAALCLAGIAYAGLRAARTGHLPSFAATGVAFGLGYLTRPSMISVAPVVAFVWGAAILRRSRGRGPMLVGAAGALCIALGCLVPACWHDARAGAGWTVSTNNERNLFLGNNPYTPDYKTSHLGQRSLDELDPETRAYLASFYERPDARGAMQREALSYVLTHPGRTALRTLNRATSFWGFDYLAAREIQKWADFGSRAALPLLAIEGGSYLLVATLAIAALFAMRGVGDRGAKGWLLALALAYELPYALAFSGGTYHFPVMVLIVPLAAIAAAAPAAAWRELRASRVAWAALGVFAVVELQYAYYAITMSS